MTTAATAPCVGAQTRQTDRDRESLAKGGGRRRSHDARVRLFFTLAGLFSVLVMALIVLFLFAEGAGLFVTVNPLISFSENYGIPPMILRISGYCP